MTQDRPNRAARRGPRKQDELEIRIRSEGAQIVHVDGAWGGLTTQGLVNMGLYSESQAHPDRTVYKYPDDLPGKLTELSRIGGGYVVRQIQVQAFISIPVAKAIADWLLQKVEEAERIQKEIDERRARQETLDSAADVAMKNAESQE